MSKFKLVVAAAAERFSVDPALPEYDEGSQVKVTALPGSDLDFVSWSDGIAVISTEAELVLTLYQNLILIPEFRAKITPAPKPADPEPDPGEGEDAGEDPTDEPPVDTDPNLGEGDDAGSDTDPVDEPPVGDADPEPDPDPDFDLGEGDDIDPEPGDLPPLDDSLLDALASFGGAPTDEPPVDTDPNLGEGDDNGGAPADEPPVGDADHEPGEGDDADHGPLPDLGDPEPDPMPVRPKRTARTRRPAARRPGVTETVKKAVKDHWKLVAIIAALLLLILVAWLRQPHSEKPEPAPAAPAATTAPSTSATPVVAAPVAAAPVVPIAPPAKPQYDLGTAEGRAAAFQEWAVQTYGRVGDPVKDARLRTPTDAEQITAAALQAQAAEIQALKEQVEEVKEQNDQLNRLLNEPAVEPGGTP